MLGIFYNLLNLEIKQKMNKIKWMNICLGEGRVCGTCTYAYACVCVM